MESYCSLCTFKVPQGANNLILCTLDTIHRLFFVTRLIINKINKVQWVDFKLENVLVSLHSLKTMESYLDILLYVAYTYIYYYWNKRSYTTRPSPEYECGKINPLNPIRTTSFVSIVTYLNNKTCTIMRL